MLLLASIVVGRSAQQNPTDEIPQQTAAAATAIQMMSQLDVIRSGAI